MGFGAGMGLPNMYNCSDAFTIESRVGWGTIITMDFKHNKVLKRYNIFRVAGLLFLLARLKGNGAFDEGEPCRKHFSIL
jgi:hypothetical protein